jgi:hypothetical protein
VEFLTAAEARGPGSTTHVTNLLFRPYEGGTKTMRIWMPNFLFWQSAGLKVHAVTSLLFSCICHSAVLSAVAAQAPTGIRVQGPGSSPDIGFACCDKGVKEMHSLFADRNVIPSLNELHAEVAVAILDFAPERTAVVRRWSPAA